MSKKNSCPEEMGAQEGRNIHEIEELIFEEALGDLKAASQGVLPPVGEMQSAYPEVYIASRKLLSGLGQFLIVASSSFKQAEKISALIHSETEGLSSIQEILNMHPVNALTLVHLARLERKHRAKDAATARHSQPGGSRDRKAKALEEWATGRHPTRDRCAEAIGLKLGVPFSTARKWLRGAPGPSGRC